METGLILKTSCLIQTDDKSWRSDCTTVESPTSQCRQLRDLSKKTFLQSLTQPKWIQARFKTPRLWRRVSRNWTRTLSINWKWATRKQLFKNPSTRAKAPLSITNLNILWFHHLSSFREWKKAHNALFQNLEAHKLDQSLKVFLRQTENCWTKDQSQVNCHHWQATIILPWAKANLITWDCSKDLHQWSWQASRVVTV